MPQEFQYKVYLPSIADYIRVSELKNHEHLSIIKYNKNNDTEGLANYLEALIQDKISDKSINLHRIDKFCILLTMIMLCIDPVITLNATCDETEEMYELVVDVGDVLNIVTNVEYSNFNISTDQLTVNFQYPSALLATGETSLVKFINTIDIDGHVFDLYNLNSTELDMVFDYLPSSCFPKIAAKLKTLREKYNEIEVFKFQSPYVENSEPIILNVDLVENDLFELIRILFGHDMNGFYEMQFAMMSNYHFPPVYYNQCSPIEVKLFYSYMKRDVDEKNKQIEESRNSNKTPAEKFTG